MGDRVVTLAPGPGGARVTSQRAVVTAVDTEARTLTAVTHEGTELGEAARAAREAAVGDGSLRRWARHTALGELKDAVPASMPPCRHGEPSASPRRSS